MSPASYLTAPQRGATRYQLPGENSEPYERAMRGRARDARRRRRARARGIRGQNVPLSREKGGYSSAPESIRRSSTPVKQAENCPPVRAYAAVRPARRRKGREASAGTLSRVIERAAMEVAVRALRLLARALNRWAAARGR